MQQTRPETHSGSAVASTLSHGIILLLVGAALLATKPSTTEWLSITIPALPISVSTAIGSCAAVLSVLFVIAAFWPRLRGGVEGFLWRQPIKYFYFCVFWAMYSVGWLNALAAIPPERLGVPIVGYIGVLWFVAIPIAWHKRELLATWQRVRLSLSVAYSYLSRKWQRR